jgi:4-amino-4-deoxy-L-arabinose transferase-like glycosyltransferase
LRKTPRRCVVWLIIIGAGVRLALAATVGLGVDESYAVASARQASLSYFDHPPLSFWLAHAAARVFGTESHVVVRLPFILLFAATTWLMYRLTARAFGERAGWLAALLLNISAVFSVSTGSWVLPDGPLMCGLAAAAYGLERVLLDPAAAGHPWRWWLAAGAATGVALLSKYQAVLFVAGVLVFMITRPAGRRWLRQPAPYAAGALALALFTPVLVWNARHGWVSFAFQSGRGASPPHLTAGRVLGAVGQNVAGQMAWVLPWIWIPLVVALVHAFRRRPTDDRYWLFACLAVVPIALFTAVSLGGRPGQPHWPASGYLFLFPLLGAGLVEREQRGAAGVGPARPTAADGRLPTWVLASAVAFIALLAAAGVAAITGFPFSTFPRLARGGDPTLEAADWGDLHAGLDSLGVLGRPRTFVAAPSWVQAGKVAYALGPGVPVLCLSVDPREFAYLHDQRTFLGQDAIIVARLPASPDVAASYAPYFETVVPIGRVTIHRWRSPVFEVGVYRGHDFRRTVPAPATPRGALATVIPAHRAAGYLPPDPAPPYRPEPTP